MHHSFLIVTALFAPYVIALPLNINLGAYSPALVVGDGEISFGGKQDVSNLMNALEGAAVAGGAANRAATTPTIVPTTAAALTTPSQSATTIQATPNDDTQITTLQGMGKEIAPRVVKLIKDSATERDITGFNAALSFATGALKTSPEIQLGTGEGGSGVGITQKAGTTAAQEAAVVEARGEIPSPKMKTTVTTMFVRGGAAPAGSSPLLTAYPILPCT